MGRGAGDYIFNIGDFGEEGSLDRRLYHSVSFTHLEIFRTSEGVFLTDHSSNGELLLDILSGQDCNSGTWIDGVKVGKGSTRVLKNTAEIAFPHQSKKMFVFISDEKDDDIFPQELTSKFTVGKLLGAGSGGEVRLAFRIPDLHRVAVKIINYSSKPLENDQ